MCAVSRHSSTHMLVDVIPCSQLGLGAVYYHTEVAVRVYGEARYCRLFRLDDVYGCYMRTDAYTPCLGPVTKRLMSQVYSLVNSVCFNSCDISDYLSLTLGSTLQMPKIEWPVKHGIYERSKITATHHTHLRPQELEAVAEGMGGRTKFVYAVCLQRLLSIGVVTEAVYSSFLAYIIGVEYNFALLLLRSTTVWSGTRGEEQLLSKLKSFASAIKASHSAKYQPLTQLFELTVLLNRGIGSVDWAGEKENRVNPNTVDLDPADVYKSSMTIFRKARKSGYKYPKMHYDKFIESRWEWIPGGSVHSQYVDDDEYIYPGLYTRNKFITVNKMPSHHLQLFLSSTPQIKAWTSTKYEWGKQRAIYGTDLRSTIITNFAMYRCEEVLLHLFPVGDQADVEKVHRRISMMLDGYDSFCFDYDDFNSQHSLSSMQAVLLAYMDAFSDVMSPEQLQAMEWVILSVADMQALSPTDNEWYRLTGTLLSGWRLTTFMNTVLNWVYMDVAGVFNIDGVHDSVHNGDDVMISISSIKAANLVMNKMHKVNARAQPTKCNVLSISEFLRIEHGMSGYDGLGAQYLSRSCATLVHSRVESKEPITATRLVEADLSRLKDYRSRCANVDAVDLIQQQLFCRTAKLFNIELGNIYKISELHRVVGGCSDRRWAPIEQQVTTTSGKYEIPHEIDDPSFWPGVNDYSAMLYRKIGEQVKMSVIVDAVSQGSRLTIAKSRSVTLAVERTANIKAKEWERALYRTYKGSTVHYYANLAKFLNVPPLFGIETRGGASAISAALASSDTMRALKVLL
ncbi:RNA polymerase [Tuber aestivum virus 1]|uniref:RNA-directed RNA polymerase n=1 Tax=Tuber aestivum virus 1 TaxID=927810 RepID=E5KIN7_9VIRU|nr:RNA polymerase [Tuber aestivum virus 1]ADQ54106.1 RNA polymerase [Tuber aestivum virus 1]